MDRLRGVKGGLKIKACPTGMITQFLILKSIKKWTVHHFKNILTLVTFALKLFCKNLKVQNSRGCRAVMYVSVVSPEQSYHSNDQNSVYFPKHKYKAALALKVTSRQVHCLKYDIFILKQQIKLAF